jgi:hypothetical protein
VELIRGDDTRVVPALRKSFKVYSGKITRIECENGPTEDVA